MDAECLRIFKIKKLPFYFTVVMNWSKLVKNITRGGSVIAPTYIPSFLPFKHTTTCAC